MTTREQRIAAIEKDWAENPRWAGIKRGYTAADVERLRGSFPVEYTLARRGAEKLWNLVNNEPYINCLRPDRRPSAQQVKAGIKAIYLSGWQVAADNNEYPPCTRTNPCTRWTPCPRWLSASTTPSPALTKSSTPRASKPATRATSTTTLRSWPMLKPVSAACWNAFELMKSMIRAGAAGVHWEDQLASVKKCGHMGGKVLVPTQEAVQS